MYGILYKKSNAFDPEFLTLKGLLEDTGALEQLESLGLTIPIYILISCIQAVTFAPFFNMFAALGEEVGWRGALYPYLKEKLGISTVMMGILFDYVYEKTETIWLPSLMHGATNAFTIFAYLSKPEYTDKAILGPAYIGIISMIPMIIMAVIICVKQKKS